MYFFFFLFHFREPQLWILHQTAKYKNKASHKIPSTNNRIGIVIQVRCSSTSSIMSEDAVFFRQAAEAIVATSLNSENVDPTIRELLSRIKYVSPDAKESSAHTNTSLLPSENIRIDGSENESNIALKRKKGKGTEDNEDTQDGKGSSLSERQFHCAKCKLVFRRSSDLRRHERTHLPVLPNICSQCGKGFARKDALKRHFDTLTCRRNRSKLLSIGGDINEILERAQQTGTGLWLRFLENSFVKENKCYMYYRT